MEETMELEEGEAYCYQDGSDNSIDPDVAFAYIGEKLHNVLGHLQKDFEGGVSAENLGAKFGGYGSFLPTSEHSPSVWSQTKSPQRNQITLKSPNIFHVEGAVQNFTASNVPSTLKPATASTCANSSHKSRFPSGDLPVRKDLCLSSTQVFKNLHSENEGPGITSNHNKQGTLKFRLRTGADTTKRANAALYSGLGLEEDSQSSSLESSPESSRDVPLSCDVEDESLSGILQMMTSYLLPESFLVSPLHERLLCLTRRDRLIDDIDPMPLLKNCREDLLRLEEKRPSFQGDRKIIKEKKVKSKRRSENIVEVMQSKPIPLSVSYHDREEHTKVFGQLPEYMETSKDHLKDRMLSANLTKEESLESMSGQDSGKSKKKQNSSRSVKKAGEHRVVKSFMGTELEPLDKDCCKANHPVQKASIPEEGDCQMPSKRERLLIERKKKQKRISSDSKQVAYSTAETSKVYSGAAPRVRKGASFSDDLSRDEVHKSKSEKSINEVQNAKGSRKESVGRTTLEHMDNQLNMARPSLHGSKMCIRGDLDPDKLEERSSSKRADHQFPAGEFVKNAPYTGAYIMENGQTSEAIPAAPAAVVIEENWVQCDSCQKWRLLPFGIQEDSLPEKWLCSMLTWLPGMNRCDISEEETTKALQEKYISPAFQVPNNLQNHANGSPLEVASCGDQRHDQNQQNFSSGALSIPQKKKDGLKGLPNTGSNGVPMDASNYQKQEPLKNNDMKWPSTKSKLMKKSSFQHLSKSDNLRGQQAQINRGGLKKIKMKNKREADPSENGAVKKIRIESGKHADRHQNTGTDISGLGLRPSSDLSIKERKKDVQKYDCQSGDLQHTGTDRLLISLKRSGNKAQVSCNDLDIRHDKRENHPRKRKLKGQAEDLGLKLHDSELFTKEESSEGRFRKEKKLKALKSENINGDSDIDTSDRKGRVTQALSSGDRDSVINGKKEARSSDRDQQPKKQPKKLAPKLTIEAVDELRRDLETNSATATSSSSKISGSHKYKVNYEEVKGSPVESVSSSPFRTSNPDKHPFASGDIMGKDVSINCGLPTITRFGRCSDGEIIVEAKKPGISRKQKRDFQHAQNSRKESSSQFRSEDGNPAFNFGSHKNKASNQVGEPEEFSSKKSQGHDSVIDAHHYTSLHEHTKDLDCHLPDKCNTKSYKDKENYLIENGSRRQWSNNNRDKDDCLLIESRNEAEGKETRRASHPPRPGSQKGGMCNGQPVEASQDVDMSKPLKRPVPVNKAETPRSSVPLTANQHGVRDYSTSSPAGKEFMSQTAASALKEAKDLKDKADYLKNSGFGFESNEAYFQAALKFLHGASLLDTCSSDSGRYEIEQMQMYITTAKLCGNCAHEYENRREMAAAALAYKCMEVAYMRVVYCKNSSTSRDRHELQAGLQMTTQGESPSSSASDVDNLNNQAVMDKGNVSKTVGSHASGNHVVIARSRPNFVRLLDFTQDVSCAMEASRKSQVAFAAANVKLEGAHNQECITSVKRVIDFSFQDIEGLIRLVERAHGAISRLGFCGSRN